MSIYRRELRLRSSDVDMHRRLRTSALFALLQEAAIAHTEQLGMGREKTLDRGALWIVTLQTAQILRMPTYDEDVVLRSWPGRTMHVLFPRYYAMDTAAGEPLLRASALWTLIDSQTRQLVYPERLGVAIEGVSLPADEIPLPTAPKAVPTTGERVFTVPYSYVDLNGHMNNTRYFDLAEDCIPAAASGRALRAVSAEFSREVRFGESLCLQWGQEGPRWYFTGSGEKKAFRMSFTYDGE
jgi:acyl-ACP thioesterase